MTNQQVYNAGHKKHT